MHGLVDMYANGEGLVAPAIAGAADRRGAEIIEPDRDPQMCVGCRDLVGGIESDPPELLDMRFGPSMAGILFHDTVVAEEIAADIAGRDAETARTRDKDMRQVLTDTAFDGEGFLCGGRGMRRVDVERHLGMNGPEKSMQDGKRIRLLRGGFGRRGEIAQSRVRRRQWRFAQKQSRRKTLDSAANDPVRVVGVDFSLDMDVEF